MEEKNANKRREWIKNVAIIFLAAMLLLTFFSNTIMNYSLPEVSAQYPTTGNLSEQIRGTLAVQAAQNYEMKLDETRVVASVHFKNGDTVKKGDVLITLEDKDSTELKTAIDALQTAKDDLDTLKFDYKKMLISGGFDYSQSELEISNLEDDIQEAKNNIPQIKNYQDEYEAAKQATIAANATVNKYTKLKDKVSAQLTALSSDSYAAMDKEYYDKLSAMQKKIKEAEQSKTDAEAKVAAIEKEAGSSTSDDTIAAKQLAVKKASQALDKCNLEYYAAIAEGKATIDLLMAIQSASTDYDAAVQEYNNAVAQNTSDSNLRDRLKIAQHNQEFYTSSYNSQKNQLDTLKLQYSRDFNELLNQYSDKLDAANAALDKAKADEETAKNKAATTVEAAEADIKKNERDLETKKAALRKQQADDLKTQGSSAIDIEAKQNAIVKKEQDISQKEQDVDKLRAKAINVDVPAQVGGTIQTISCTAGETIDPNTTFATIQMTEKGYVASLSVTADQAKKVNVGDEADVENFWNGTAKVVLTAIKPDTNSPQNKLLEFTVSGDVTQGTSVQIVMGAAGRHYDIIVPSNAIREDSNGKFVLAVVAKNTPLGNRYIAKRIGVTVLAANDKTTAVSGEIMQSDFIITTATKPVEAGTQVRLVENTD